MIGKLTKGTSHAGALKYDLEKKGAVLLETNCASNDWREIAVEMDTVASSNTRCKNRCLHLSISAPDGEHLNDQQWIQAANIAMKALDLDDHQYVITRHADAHHDHIHITINRIDFEGRSWSDSQDFKRVHESMRTLENTMNLQRIEDHQITAEGRYQQVKNDFDISIKTSIGQGLSRLISEMKLRGYTLIKNLSKKTGRISGISVQSDHDQKTWKASELRKGGYKGIEQLLDDSLQQHRSLSAATISARASIAKDRSLAL